MTEARTPLAFAGGHYASRPPRPHLFFDPALLRAPLSALPGVGTVLTRRLAGLGLVTVGDLIEHYPRRYEDFTQRKRIAELRLGEEATVRGVVERVRAERTARRNVRLTRVTLRDESGVLEAVWFNQPYLADVFAEGMQLSLRGTYKPQGASSHLRRQGARDPRREGGDRAHGGHRAGVPGERGGLGTLPAHAGAPRDAGHAAAARPVAGGAARAGASAVAGGRGRGSARAQVTGRGASCARASRARGAAADAARAAPAQASRGGARRALSRCPRPPDSPAGSWATCPSRSRTTRSTPSPR